MCPYDFDVFTVDTNIAINSLHSGKSITLVLKRIIFHIFNCSLFTFHFYGVHQIGEVTFGCKYQISSIK